MLLPLRAWCPSGEMGKGKEDGHQVDGCIPTAHMYQCQHPKRCNAQKDVIKVLESVREWVGVESSVNREAIEQHFTSAGWKLDGSFSEYLIIGSNSDSLSILAYAQAREPEDPVFELIDHERDLTYGVQQIPTPHQAWKLLQEHGQLAEE